MRGNQEHGVFTASAFPYTCYFVNLNSQRRGKRIIIGPQNFKWFDLVARAIVVLFYSSYESVGGGFTRGGGFIQVCFKYTEGIR